MKLNPLLGDIPIARQGGNCLPDLLIVSNITILRLFWNKTVIANIKSEKTVLSLNCRFFLPSDCRSEGWFAYNEVVRPNLWWPFRLQTMPLLSMVAEVAGIRSEIRNRTARHGVNGSPCSHAFNQEGACHET